jgi:hypothetical protein
VLQERIPCGARCSRISTSTGRVTMRDMLVDLAPYLFRGKLAAISRA